MRCLFHNIQAKLQRVSTRNAWATPKSTRWSFVVLIRETAQATILRSLPVVRMAGRGPFTCFTSLVTMRTWACGWCPMLSWALAIPRSPGSPSPFSSFSSSFKEKAMNSQRLIRTNSCSLRSYNVHARSRTRRAWPGRLAAVRPWGDGE